MIVGMSKVVAVLIVVAAVVRVQYVGGVMQMVITAAGRNNSTSSYNCQVPLCCPILRSVIPMTAVRTAVGWNPPNNWYIRKYTDGHVSGRGNQRCWSTGRRRPYEVVFF